MVKVNSVQPHEHKAKLSHELIAGAAAFEVRLHVFLFLFIDVLMDIPQAAKAYQDHCKGNGKPGSHAKAKELLYILFLSVSGRYVLTLDTGPVSLVSPSTGLSRPRV